MLSQDLLDRVIFGPLAAAVIALTAYKARTLTRSGAVAAFAAGTIAIAAGWSWGLLLVGYFVSAGVLSKLGEGRKTALLGPLVEKGGARDAWQVAANGVAYVTAAAAFIISGSAHWYAFGIGALAASAADTWSTEIGTLGGRVPRLIVSGRKVPPGTSGALSLAGTLGAVAGALSMVAGARLAGWPVPIAAIVAGGLAGAFGDSLFGATIQSRRWCGNCKSSTERLVHDCGTMTTQAHGLSWLDNDGVNFVSTIIGGLVALLLAGTGSAS